MIRIKEDAFGTPPAARGSMNVVAGKEDDLDPGEELLIDDSEMSEHDDVHAGDGMDTMDGPIYPEGKIFKTTIGELRNLISRLY
jgi:hypothetical protein